MKKPSPETELRRLRRERDQRLVETNTLRREILQLRGQLTQAQQNAAEWRGRFDALLARVPLSPMGEALQSERAS